MFKSNDEFRIFQSKLTNLLSEFLEKQNNIIQISNNIHNTFSNQNSPIDQLIETILNQRNYISRDDLINSKEEIKILFEDRMKAASGSKEIFDSPENSNLLNKTINNLIRKNPEVWFEIVSEITHFAKSFRDEDSSLRINASLLVLMVTDFEVLITNSIKDAASPKTREIYKEMARGKEADFLIDQLLKHEKTSDIITEMTISKLDSDMRGGYKSWFKIISETLGVKNCSLDNLPGLEVILETRHLIVHTGGIDVEQYRLSYNQSKYAAPSDGGNLEITKNYLKQSADALAVSALIIIIRILTEYCNKNEDRVSYVEEYIVNVTYKLLVDSRPRVAKEYIDTLPLDRFASHDSLSSIKVNKWIAMRDLNEQEKMRIEVEKWATQSLHPRFQMAKYALMGEHTHAISIAQLLPALGGEQYIMYWHEWPLLRQTREYAFKNKIQVFNISGQKNVSNNKNILVRDSKKIKKKRKKLNNRKKYLPKGLRTS